MATRGISAAKTQARLGLVRVDENRASQPAIFSEITGARARTAPRSHMLTARSLLSGWLVGVMAIPPLGRFVHERGRVLVHVSARARCTSASIPIAAVTASEGQMGTRFRGRRVDRHDSSVCTSHVPSHERRSQTRLFKGSFWSFVGKVGDFNRQRNLRGVSPGLGRRAFGNRVIRGFRGPWRLPGRAP